ncbi:MAG: DNA mismatch repair endonuclease MutL [Thermodesulfobacteriota bacterium]
MGKIKIIHEVLANKIAAGEVVERPASIVKELVENSLDAGAKDISIETIDGGKRYIKVRDDGEGMPREDVILSVERHATSKIIKDEDLFAISTLGFRGEALPSIASVSKVDITTKTRGAISGTKLLLRDGKVSEVIESGCPEGTTIEVRDLFYNTPARQKFLKTTNTELGHIIDTVTKYTLSHPEVKFTLLHKGKKIFNTLKGDDMRARVSGIIDRDVAKNLIDFRDEREDVSIHGFISSPEHSLSNRKGQYYYVNRRWVSDRLITHAITEGCRPFFMKDRFPIVILFIKLPPSEVDVNVHPAKREVRFKDTNKIYNLILMTFRDAFSSKSPARRQNSSIISYKGKFVFPPTKPFIEPNRVKEPIAPYKPVKRDIEGSFDFLLFDNMRSEASEERIYGSLSKLDIIGQLWDSYILCQDGESLILLDQHAAHERIVFERIRKEYHSSGGLKGQPLLVPQVLELSSKEKTILSDTLNTFMGFGIEIEPFGGNDFVIKTLPLALMDRDCQTLVKDVLHEVSSIGKGNVIKDSIDGILITMACHSVIRGKRVLDKKEIEALLKDLEKTEISTNCPHGRPIFKRFSRLEIERFFKR